MDINALKTLATIAELGSFSAAAEKLSLTQPAISKRISKLERYFDTVLLERDGRITRLTASGALLINETQSLVQQFDNVKYKVASINNQVSGHLNIITSHHIGIHRLPPTLKRFNDKHPNVKINLSFADSEVAYRQIESSQDDFGIVTLGPNNFPKINSEVLWKDELIIMVTKDHTLSNSKATIEQLAKEPAVLPGLETYTGQIVKNLFDQYQLSLQANMATNYLETIKMMVSVGLGWTMLPKTMLDNTLSQVIIPNLQAERQLGLIYRKSYQASPAAQAFLTLLRDSV